MSRLMVVLAVIWTIGFGLWFAFGPVYYGTAATVNSGLAANGPILLLVLGAPLLLAVAPLFVPRARQRSAAGIAAILTLAFVLLALISVGYFYLPSAAALAIAAVWPARSGQAVADVEMAG